MLLCAQAQSISNSSIPNELNGRILMLHTVFQFGARYVGVAGGLEFFFPKAQEQSRQSLIFPCFLTPLGNPGLKHYERR